MPPLDPMEAAFSRPVAWPMEPTKILLALGKLDPGIYLSIYRAHAEYERKCSQAKNEMHNAIIASLEELLNPERGK